MMKNSGWPKTGHSEKCEVVCVIVGRGCLQGGIQGVLARGGVQGGIRGVGYRGWGIVMTTITITNYIQIKLSMHFQDEIINTIKDVIKHVSTFISRRLH